MRARLRAELFVRTIVATIVLLPVVVVLWVVFTAAFAALVLTVLAPVIDVLGILDDAGIDVTVPALLLLAFVVPIGGYCTVRFWRYLIASTVEGFIEEVTTHGVPAHEAAPALEATVRRLAQQAGISQPAVVVVETDRPESYTIGLGDDTTIVVSAGLLDTLDENERTAVLAHEISHIANGDMRLLLAAFTPLYLTHDAIEHRESIGDVLFAIAYLPFRTLARIGVSVLSVGRERAADSAAIELTGEPAALASALAAMDETRSTPDTDLREWEQSLSALDILPPDATADITGRFPTHPPTATRIDRAQARAAPIERE